MAGCSPSDPVDRFPVDGGQAGWTAYMPVRYGEQRGTMPVAGTDVTVDIAIAVDSGITFVASHFRLPQQVSDLPPEDRTQLAWNTLMDRLAGRDLDQRPPVALDPAKGRSGWFMNEEDIIMGVVLHVRDDVAVVLNAGTPEVNFQRAGPKMERYLTSFEWTGERP